MAASARGRRVLVVLDDPQARPRGHEQATQRRIAEALAQVMGWDVAGNDDGEQADTRRRYFVPRQTLLAAQAERLGIRGPQDLFGGVVPQHFVAGKTITHALAPGARAMPAGWSPAFARAVAGAVLPGYSAFARHDARIAGRELLREGAVRVKRAGSSGGTGQWTVTSAQELDDRLAAIDDAEWQRDGVVLERLLEPVSTLSVGQVRVGALRASYLGTQQLTRNHAGHAVYGGSRLSVVRGGFDALLARLDPPAELRTAVEQARRYHRAALRAFPGMYASRCNYDIAQGPDSAGQWRSGVLEQSWRIGGASGAEIEALRALREDPSRELAVASTTEVYELQTPPPGATVYFSGVDDRVGALTKYARLEPDAHA